MRLTIAVINMKAPKYPSLYQINTRVWLTDLGTTLGRPATLDDITDEELSNLANRGFDWIWLLSVWTTGEIGRSISRKNPEWRRDFESTVPDLQEGDIAGSGFSIARYQVHPKLGGNAALKRLRTRISKQGLKLMLDFVPNHMGPDHPWVEEHPEYFVSGTEADIEQFPQNYTRERIGTDEKIFAYGRDPYFSGWPDTIQLDYSNPATLTAMTRELVRIAGQCDGVRCDMAMLILPEVFEKTWGRPAQSFWPEAINKVRENTPDFCFMAEVYWDMEWRLQQEGFDYAYDKRLYDRLTEGQAKAVREHFFAALEYQDKLSRFLENHDEPRAASTLGQKNHEAAAVITFLSPGLRFFHQGQFEGRTKRISPHLVRMPHQQINSDLQNFYNGLLAILIKPIFRNGAWELPECFPSWVGNGTWDNFISFAWKGEDGEMVLIAVNYAPMAGHCYIRLPFPELAGRQWQLRDLMTGVRYHRNGNDLVSGGLYLDVQAWQYHIFEIIAQKNQASF